MQKWFKRSLAHKLETVVLFYVIVTDLGCMETQRMESVSPIICNIIEEIKSKYVNGHFENNMRFN